MNTETTSAVIAVIGRAAGDVVSFGIVLGTLAKILPPLAALISILWIGYQFYYSEPMREHRRKKKEKQYGNT
jgi:hypothetical protein